MSQKKIKTFFYLSFVPCLLHAFLHTQPARQDSNKFLLKPQKLIWVDTRCEAKITIVLLTEPVLLFRRGAFHSNSLESENECRFLLLISKEKTILHDALIRLAELFAIILPPSWLYKRLPSNEYKRVDVRQKQQKKLKMPRKKSKYNVKEKVDLLKQPVQQNAVKVKLYFGRGSEILSFRSETRGSYQY